MIRKVATFLTLPLLLTGLLIAPVHTSALSGSQFKAGRIIDDAIFFNPVGMSASQIQNFFNVKVPVCDTYGTKMYNSTQTRSQWAAANGKPAPPYTCLKDYRQNTPERMGESGLCSYLPAKNNQSAAQIIHDVANACSLNPKVLIVLLQKEQSLVTDDWPWPEQYTKATGFACPDTAPCDPAYAGFFYQIHNAARQFKRYSVDKDLFNYRASRNNNILWHPNSACGSSTVYIENQATAGLYNYTPYRPNAAALNNLYGTGDSCSSYGNRNFWRMFNDWFGSTAASYIINVPGTSTLYLLSGGTRYGIPSQDVLRAYGFHTAPITSVSNSYLASLTDGGILSTLFTFEGSNTVRLADNSRHFGIPNSQTCDNWGLPCFNSNYQKQLSTFLSALIPSGGTVKGLMWTPYDSYSLMQNGQKRPYIPGDGIVDAGYTASSATPISTPINANKPAGNPIVSDDEFVAYEGSSVIYYHNAGSYYNFNSYTSLLAWSGDKKVHVDDKSALRNNPPAATGMLSNFVNNGTSKYYVDNGRKYDISAISTHWPNTVDHSFVAVALNRMPTSSVTTETIFRDYSTGAMYQVKDKKRNVFQSMKDFYASDGPSKPLVNVSGMLYRSLAAGYTLLGQGSLFETPSSGSVIFLVSKDGTKHSLLEFNQIQRLGLSAASVWDVNSDTSTVYLTANAFKDIIRAGSTHFTLTRDNKKVEISDNFKSKWGLDTADSVPLTSFVTDKIPSQKISPHFAVAKNGTIYYSHSGTKRPIGSFKRYVELGGYSGNTFQATDPFLASLPTGALLP